MKHRLTLLLLIIAALAAVIFCLLWQHAERDRSDLTALARSGAAEACARFSDYQLRGDESDWWGGVAGFRVFADAYVLLAEDRPQERAVCSAVYGSLLLDPDGAKTHLPELTAIMELLSRDPADLTAHARLSALRSALPD